MVATMTAFCTKLYMNQHGNNYDYTFVQDCKDIKVVIFVLIVQGYTYQSDITLVKPQSNIHPSFACLIKLMNIVAAFGGMNVSPVKHSYA